MVYFEIGREVFLLALLVCAAFTDLAYGKVYNWCSLPGLILGLALAYGLGGLDGGTSGTGRGAVDLADSGLGVLVFGGVFGVYCLFGAFGMGDVKLAAAIGALKGWRFALGALGFTALVGGVLALGLVIWKGQLRRTLKDTVRFAWRPHKMKQASADSPGRLTIPFAFAVSVGTMLAWFRYVA